MVFSSVRRLEEQLLFKTSFVFFVFVLCAWLLGGVVYRVQLELIMSA